MPFGCLGFVGTAIFLSLAELWLLIKVSALIGLLPTVALCMLTAGIGGALVRAQGLQTLARIQERTAQGEVPADELVGGLLLLVTGVLLVVPGFITDTASFLILLPGVRTLVSRWLVDKVIGKMQFAGTPGAFGGFSGGQQPLDPFGSVPPPRFDEPNDDVQEESFDAQPRPGFKDVGSSDS